MLMTPMRARALAHRQARERIKKFEKDFMKNAFKPVYDANSIPLEVGLGRSHTKFEYEMADLRREVCLKTEEDILEDIASQCHVGPQAGRGTRRLDIRTKDVLRLMPSCVSEEVKEQWRDILRQGELRRGRLYNKE